MRSDTKADRSKGLSPKTEKQAWNQQSPQKACFTSSSVKPKTLAVLFLTGLVD
jgi:hypothetical protein